MMVIVENGDRPTEGVHHEEPNTTLYVAGEPVGKGTLYVTESIIQWVDGNKKLQIPYPNIELFAVSKDLSTLPCEGLYLHTDADLPSFAVAPPDEDMDEGNDDDEDTKKLNRLLFGPDNKESLNSIYQAIIACQRLHPELDDEFSPEEDLNESDEDEMEDADSQLADMRLNGEPHTNGDDVNMDPDCFEDAEEYPPEN